MVSSCLCDFSRTTAATAPPFGRCDDVSCICPTTAATDAAATNEHGSGNKPTAATN